MRDVADTLYVAITRAKVWVSISYQNRVTQFLEEAFKMSPSNENSQAACAEKNGFYFEGAFGQDYIDEIVSRVQATRSDADELRGTGSSDRREKTLIAARKASIAARRERALQEKRPFLWSDEGDLLHTHQEGSAAIHFYDHIRDKND
jgi:hypothetical protein